MRKGHNLIPLVECAGYVGRTRKQLNRLAREKKIKAKKIGNIWYTTKAWLDAFFHDNKDGYKAIKKAMKHSVPVVRKEPDKSLLDEVDRLRKDKYEQTAFFITQLEQLKERVIFEQDEKRKILREIAELKQDMHRSVQGQVNNFIQHINEKESIERQIGFLRDSFVQGLEQMRYITEQTINDRTTELVEQMNEELQKSKINDVLERMSERFEKQLQDFQPNYEYFDLSEVPIKVLNSDLNLKNNLSLNKAGGARIVNYPQNMSFGVENNSAQVFLDISEAGEEDKDPGDAILAMRSDRAWERNPIGESVVHYFAKSDSLRDEYWSVENFIPRRLKFIAIGTLSAMLFFGYGLLTSPNMRSVLAFAGNGYFPPAEIGLSMGEHAIQGAFASTRALMDFSDQVKIAYTSVPAESAVVAFKIILSSPIINPSNQTIEPRIVLRERLIDFSISTLEGLKQNGKNILSFPDERVSGAFIDSADFEPDLVSDQALEQDD